jgi:hypothetical protein
MARQNSSSPISVHIETKFLDELGEESQVAHYREEMIQDPVTGDIISRKVSENMTLASGESFNPSMSAGANPVMLVGTCSFCNSARKRFSLWRNRKSNPLCNVKHLKRCFKCGKPACPKHIRCSHFDNQWRCLKHHRLHMLFMGIFFEEAEK